MSTALEPPEVSPDGELKVLLARLHEVIDDLQEFDQRRVADRAVLPAVAAVERAVRRLPIVRAGLVAELGPRGIPAARQVRSSEALLRIVLRVSHRDAKAYVRDADELVARSVLSTGEQLPPLRPHIAAAVKQGVISPEQARLIAATMRRVPAAVPPDRAERGEADLVQHAQHFDPARLARICQRLLDCLDPDGTLEDDTERAARRGVTIGRRGRSGLSPLSGLLDDETRAYLEAALEPLSGPQHTKLERDERTAPQRRHDGLRELAKRALASGDLPSQAGLPATLLISATLAQLEARTGMVSTGTGGTIPVKTVLRSIANMHLVGIVFDHNGRPLYCGQQTRLGNEGQRHTTFVQDLGCVIPDCDQPAIRAQLHHFEDHAGGGPTDVDKLGWVCPYHHTRIDGWKLERIHGRVWCTPPKHLDPDQVPRLNHTFHPDDLFTDLPPPTPPDDG